MTNTIQLSHYSVLCEEIISSLPETSKEQTFLDLTTGGAGHTAEILKKRQNWKAVCWDRDPDAESRIRARLESDNLWSRVRFEKKNFATPPADLNERFIFVLADLGVSSFQIDDPKRGLSLFSPAPPDFRMDTDSGVNFEEWLRSKSELQLEEIFYKYGEEPKARVLARGMKNLSGSSLASAKSLADAISSILKYPRAESRTHPATRAFQALRIAINDELGELKAILDWVPKTLVPGGRFAVISFHSLEDRFTKISFQDLVNQGGFGILSKKPIVPSDREVSLNSRSASAKLRVLEKTGTQTLHEDTT